jgi:hypothetical protein
MTNVNNVYQSRWGFHSCNYETYLKLKKLKKYYWKAIYRIAEWNRWNNKLPHNRIIRKWHRNEKGQRVGFEIVGQKPEPQRLPVFTREVLSDFENARLPYKTVEEIKPLYFSLNQIDSMLKELENFSSE